MISLRLFARCAYAYERHDYFTVAQAHRLQVLRKAAFPAKPQSVVSLEHQLKVLHAEVVLLRRSKATFTAQARQFDQTVRELRDREEVHLREIAALQAQVSIGVLSDSL